MTPPLHSLLKPGDSLAEPYFRPPSMPERPALKVEAFFDGFSFFYERANHGEPWTLTRIDKTQ